MAGRPRVSIVVPLFNDEAHVAAALKSCLAQTLRDVEIICVDDASTDGTVEIVERYQLADPRIRLIRQPKNLSAFQARLTGVAAATAPYTLFLDGDDELTPRAAHSALEMAESRQADVVGFGVDIVTDNSAFPHRFEAALQPHFRELTAPNIIPSLFPVGEAANGHLWRYLFSTTLLRKAYEHFPADLAFYRANDLPIAFLALSYARHYVSTNERLYRYYFRRGTSGHAIDGISQFQFLLSGIDPITAARESVISAAESTVDPESVLRSYESARLHIVGNVLRNCMRDTSGELRAACLLMLKNKVGDLDLVRASAMFCEEALSELSMLTSEPSQPPKPIRSILLATAHLDVGGLQSVLIDQAIQLSDSGYRVSVAVLRDTNREVPLPPNVDVVVLSGSTADRVDQLTDICRERAIDVIIDHHILYNDSWPWFALAALAVDVPTIGWVHNFALRTVFDHSQRASFLATHMRILLKVVTLSPVDVAYWKLQGVQRAMYLPNPASPLMLEALSQTSERSRGEGPIELAWWGRLDGPTKQVHHLVEIAAELRARGVDFRLRIVGPDSKNLSAVELRRVAGEQGVDDAIDLVGERNAQELIAELSRAHLFISTSAIEGFQLTILEAQALGMPVVMYDLPWLTTVRSNDGLITTPPDDRGAIADVIAGLAKDPQRYATLAKAARAFAVAAAEVDVRGLLIRMLNDELPVTFSPDPSLDDARILVQWLVRYSERSFRSGLLPSELVRLQRQEERARNELRNITEGPSYRLGRMLTFVPRKVKGFLLSSRRPGKAS